MPDEKLIKSWPYDPEKLSYKEWIALPSDEQYEVLMFLRQQTHERVERRGPLKGKAYEDYEIKLQRLNREVAAEQKRTGRIMPGWIVMGEGVVVHCLIGQLPPGMKWVEPNPPRK
jgi:hypothetical protein